MSSYFNAFLLFTLLSFLICDIKPKALQERAMVNSYDPNYVKNPQAFTRRLRRGDSYRTNMSATILHPWGNNVTLSFFYTSKRTGNDLFMQVKCCDSFSQPWMADFIWTYFHIKKTCPFPVGHYTIQDLELPPKNFPFPLPKGEIVLISTFSLTESKHAILKMSIKNYI